MKSGKKSLLESKKKSCYHLLAGAACGFLAFAGILCICAAVLCNIDLPLKMLSPIMITAVCVSVLSGAMVFTRLQKKRGLLSGALFGAGVFLLIWLISILQGGTALTQLAAIKALSVVCAGACGGYLGVLQGEKKRKLH
ncbi:MAG: TIGR04086 family membrane protein [Ruthenibacterium sp.]